MVISTTINEKLGYRNKPNHNPQITHKLADGDTHPLIGSRLLGYKNNLILAVFYPPFTRLHNQNRDCPISPYFELISGGYSSLFGSHPHFFRVRL